MERRPPWTPEPQRHSRWREPGVGGGAGGAVVYDLGFYSEALVTRLPITVGVLQASRPRCG